MSLNNFNSAVSIFTCLDLRNKRSSLSRISPKRNVSCLLLTDMLPNQCLISTCSSHVQKPLAQLGLQRRFSSHVGLERAKPLRLVIQMRTD